MSCEITSVSRSKPKAKPKRVGVQFDVFAFKKIKNYVTEKSSTVLHPPVFSPTD